MRGFCFLFIGFVLGFLLLFEGCKPYCPAVSGTGTIKPNKRVFVRKKFCAGTKSTGTIKPKQSKKIQDGLYSKKMAKSIEKKQEEKNN